MKRILTRLVTSGVSVAGVLAVAHAAPLQRPHVISEPLWVLHVDADALRPTTLGQHLLAEMEKPEAQQKFAAFQAIFSFDPRKELHGLTLYGASKAEEDGVLLIHADFDAARLTTLAEGARDHKSTTRGSYTIHNWIDDNKKEKNGVKPRTFAAIHGKTVIFAQKESRIADALDVLDGKKPNLSGNPRFARLGEGSAFLQGAARKMDLPANDPNAAVLRQAKMLTLRLSESQRKVEALLTIEAESEEVATLIETVGRGLLSLMALQKEKPEAQRLAQGLTVQREAAVVLVKLALPAQDVVEMMKADAARKAAKETTKEKQ
jgi:hypothetical protein